MVDAAERAGVKLMVAYMTLFNPSYQMAKLMVATGKLGEIVSVRGRHSYVIEPESISPAAGVASLSTTRRWTINGCCGLFNLYLA